ncbi:respiratory nitrate reductase 2 alpha chain [Escherichia coli]|uniref:Respiratory nitrate reductase 2 alpha chain n=1 Tax=Escherichia coli TaxID=562 RepID=A0A376ZYU7_ECOLX|nr:respiratory nitrate reductase 2 alpha chain [Escherichia coli]
MVHGQVMHSNRDWEDSYRQRWQFDKSCVPTGVNCTGSCSWKSTLKMVGDWESNRPTTRALALTCPIMNLAAARVAQVILVSLRANRLNTRSFVNDD